MIGMGWLYPTGVTQCLVPGNAGIAGLVVDVQFCCESPVTKPEVSPGRGYVTDDSQRTRTSVGGFTSRTIRNGPGEHGADCVTDDSTGEVNPPAPSRRQGQHLGHSRRKCHPTVDARRSTYHPRESRIRRLRTSLHDSAAVTTRRSCPASGRANIKGSKVLRWPMPGVEVTRIRGWTPAGHD